MQPSVYGSDHRATVDALRSGKFDFRAVAVPSAQATDRELDDLHAVGVRGIRFNLASNTAGLDAASIPRWADRIRHRGWHVQLFAEIEHFPDLEAQLAGLTVDFVIDHFGLAKAANGVQSKGFQTLLRLLARDNCWAKLIGPYRISTVPRFADVTPLAQAMVAIAPDRLVWGTDWPHPNTPLMPNDGLLADLVADWIPDADVRRKILVDNPARLYYFR